jgi:NAD(P)H dehydrogenase (quinone)
MKFFIVHAHPEPRSLNGSMTGAAVEALGAAGHEVQVSDLYAMDWDPVSDRRNFHTVADARYFKQQAEEIHAEEHGGFALEIQEEMHKLFWCDCLVLQFPLWWFGLPAIMKGWVDRVFAMGRTYGGGRWYDRGVFAGRRAMLSLTTGGPASIYAADGLNGDLAQILYPINHGILAFTGFSVLPPFVVHRAGRLTAEEAQAEIARWRATLLGIERIEPIAYPKLAEFDETLRLRRG